VHKILSQKYLLSLIVVIAGAVIAGGVVLAASDNPLIIPTDPEQATTLPQRLAQRKAAFKVQLNATQQQVIKSKCSLGQTGLQDIKTKDSAAATTRLQVYSDLAIQLANIIDHLKRQSIDTTKLAAAQKQFNDTINTYLSDAVAYKTAMDDTVVMDCAADPAGFEASLMAARQLRTQLASDVAKIKSSRAGLITVLNDSQQALIKANQR
jgi:hypothetical protein